jgi:hypothetical protein
MPPTIPHSTVDFHLSCIQVGGYAARERCGAPGGDCVGPTRREGFSTNAAECLWATRGDWAAPSPQRGLSIRHGSAGDDPVDAYSCRAVACRSRASATASPSTASAARPAQPGGSPPTGYRCLCRHRRGPWRCSRSASPAYRLPAGSVRFAVAIARRLPTSTTSRRARVTAVYSRFRCSSIHADVVSDASTRVLRPRVNSYAPSGTGAT